MFDLEIAVLGDEYAKRATRSTSTKRAATRKRGRGAPGRPKSASHRKAISAGMRRYWGSKRAAHRRRRGNSRRKTTTKRTASKKSTTKKSATKHKPLKTKAQRHAWNRMANMIFKTKEAITAYKKKHKIPLNYNGRSAPRHW